MWVVMLGSGRYGSCSDHVSVPRRKLSYGRSPMNLNHRMKPRVLMEQG